MLSAIFWDPPREAFTLPYFDLPIYWYSLFFAFGFFVGYLIVLHLVKKKFLPKQKQLAQHFVDTLAWYLFIGVLVGARLGHVFFYDWGYFSTHLLEIPLTRNGGLSSHGAVFGIFISFYFFWRYHHTSTTPPFSWRTLLDYLAVAASFTAGCIRIGNFFNQEILGQPSHLPWAVNFGHPADPEAIMPCHPAQLYEASFYFFIFLILWFLVRSYRSKLQDGQIFGMFLVSLFLFRVIIEYWKLPQETVHSGFFNMGQILSLPLIGVGIYFLIRRKRFTC